MIVKWFWISCFSEAALFKFDHNEQKTITDQNILLQGLEQKCDIEGTVLK